MFRRFLPCLSLGMLVHAAEPVALPLELGTLTTVGTGSRTYDGVTIVGKDAVGIKINHEGGTSRIAFEKLPADLRERFSVDPEAAKAQLRAEAEKNAAHDRAVEAGLRAAGEPGTKPEGMPTTLPDKAEAGEDESDEAFIARLTGTNLPEVGGKTRVEKIEALRTYIISLRKHEEKVEEEFERRGEVLSQRMGRGSEKGQKFMLRMSDRLSDLHRQQQTVVRDINRKINAAESELIALEQGG